MSAETGADEIIIRTTAPEREDHNVAVGAHQFNAQVAIVSMRDRVKTNPFNAERGVDAVGEPADGARKICRVCRGIVIWNETRGAIKVLSASGNANQGKCDG